MPLIRPITLPDHAAILRLNAECQPFVALLTEADLQHLLPIGGLHRVAVDANGTVIGYLLAFYSEAPYDDEEIRHLRHHLTEPFCYIAQVAITADSRRQGIARALYESLFATARARGLRTICSEVNTNPPNRESLAYHQRMGFTPLHEHLLSSGWTVVFLTKSLA